MHRHKKCILQLYHSVHCKLLTIMAKVIYKISIKRPANSIFAANKPILPISLSIPMVPTKFKFLKANSFIYILIHTKYQTKSFNNLHQ